MKTCPFRKGVEISGRRNRKRRAEMSPDARRVYDLVNKYLTRELEKLPGYFADCNAALAQFEPGSDEYDDEAERYGHDRWSLMKHEASLLADRRTLEAWRDAATVSGR